MTLQVMLYVNIVLLFIKIHFLNIYITGFGKFDLLYRAFDFLSLISQKLTVEYNFLKVIMKYKIYTINYCKVYISWRTVEELSV